MPIHEYECSDCGCFFDVWSLTYERTGQERVSCCHCKSIHVRKLFPGTAKGLKRQRERQLGQLVSRKGDPPLELAHKQQVDSQSSRSGWQIITPTDSEDPTDDAATIGVCGASDWLLIGASLRGRQHAHEGKYREDAFSVATTNGWNIVAVADGAGSARLARVGAQMATRACVDSLLNSLKGIEEDTIPENTCRQVRRSMGEAVLEALAQLGTEARKREIDIRDLSTTLLAVAHRPGVAGHVLCSAQIGDGLICSWSPTMGARALAQPDYGEFANETYFLTRIGDSSDVSKRVTVEQDLPLDLRYLALLTDGIADDFLPAARQLPKFFEHVPAVVNSGLVAGPPILLKLIQYNKKGSFDDRTAVVVGPVGD